MADKPYEVVPSDESHHFSYPVPEKKEELSDKAAVNINNSLAGLVRSEEETRKNAIEIPCYSTCFSIVALGAALIHQAGYEHMGAVGQHVDKWDRFVDNAIQIAASPAPVLIQYCMLAAALIALLRAFAVRSEHRDIKIQMQQKEEDLKRLNKNYNRLISSGSKDL